MASSSLPTTPVTLSQSHHRFAPVMSSTPTLHPVISQPPVITSVSSPMITKIDLPHVEYIAPSPLNFQALAPAPYSQTVTMGEEGRWSQGWSRVSANGGGANALRYEARKVCPSRSPTSRNSYSTLSYVQRR